MDFNFNLQYGYQYILFLLTRFSFLGVSFLEIIQWTLAVGFIISIVWFLVSQISNQ